MTTFQRLGDLTRDKEQAMRASALVAWALANDSHLHDITDPARTFQQKGWGRYLAGLQHKADDVVTTDETGVLPLASAFLGLVDRESLLGQLDGAVRIPLTAAARLQVGTIEASAVAEGDEKPVALLAFDVTGAPSKVVATIVLSAEALRAIDQPTQVGIRQVLVSAAAAATDVALVAALTAGTASGSTAPGDLLAAISGGAPRRPVLIGGYDSLLGMSVGTVTDLNAIGVAILPCAAASGLLIALDSAGLLISDGGVEVQTARHANLTLTLAGSPATNVSLWQSNLVALRAERSLRFSIRSGAVAYASTGSPA
jgi:hypothetical protein